MAKDVDLSSKEWRDLIFEGKNKEYGAYKMRQESNARHNKAMIVIIIVLAIVAALAFLVNTVIKAAEARPEDTGEQVLAELVTAEEPEPEPEEEQQRIEEQQPEVIKEDLLNTVKSAEIAIVPDDQAEEIKSQDEMKEDDRAIGAVNEDRGVDDIINAQEHKDVVVVEEKKPEHDDNYVFDAVEQNAAFPGGDAALLKWLSDHMNYPQTALDNGVQGTVRVRFVVKKDGTVGDAKVLKPIDPALDKEALRVVKSLPKFIPGKMNGHSVNCYFTVPVKFRIVNQG
ncbi:MAG: energy transducer TonB [Paramuribaculum sp.]|nr:energy transducer TonB [Paramuribaculum sp.]MDE6651241.1 energy transducer TonB [Paramuribaculum sp.]